MRFALKALYRDRRLRATRLRHRLEDERASKIHYRLGADVFDFVLPVLTQVIKAKAILFWINQLTELLFQWNPLSSADFNLKHRKLDTLPVVQTCLCNTSEATRARRVLGTDIITDQYKHDVNLTSIQTEGIRPDHRGDVWQAAVPEETETVQMELIPV